MTALAPTDDADAALSASRPAAAGPAALAQAIKALAREAGFQAFGITTPDGLGERERERFRQFIAEVERETQGRIKFIWPQALLQAGIFVSPRGNPGGEMAQRLLASMLKNAEPQVGLLGLLGNGPANPRAAALVPPELRRNNPTDPENARVQVVLDGNWWGANYQQANADFIDAITG